MNNRSLLERSLAAVWHPCTQMKLHETMLLVPVRRGEGTRALAFNSSSFVSHSLT